jgi:phosphomevalonate kinase
LIVSATAPGKLVVIGEYAVLAGAPALVMAVNRYCRADVGPSGDGRNHLRIAASDRNLLEFAPGEPSGTALVDLVLESVSCDEAWRGTLDTADFFDGERKLGIGSSAAAMVAWSAALSDFAGVDAAPDLGRLVAMHRRFQGGRGSGLDIAASLAGGLIEYRLGEGNMPLVANSRLPDGVGFAAVYSGNAATTGKLVGLFDVWRAADPGQANAQIDQLVDIARRGCDAARANDSAAFLREIADYGRELDKLGERIGADLVTADHREIAQHSERSGVAYKISGAGGGDLGLAFSDDPGALAAFGEAVGETYRVIPMAMSEDGLVVEERESE